MLTKELADDQPSMAASLSLTAPRRSDDPGWRPSRCHATRTGGSTHHSCSTRSTNSRRALNPGRDSRLAVPNEHPAAAASSRRVSPSLATCSAASSVATGSRRSLATHRSRMFMFNREKSLQTRTPG